MSNMNYCRFTNTRDDITDCINALTNRDIQSKEEKQAARSLLKAVINFLQDEDIINGYDPERLNEVIDECNKEV